jgi:hypothetical protein
MKPKTAKMVFLAVFLLGLVVGVIGVLWNSSSVTVIGAIILVCDFIFHMIFYRCPHCGRHLDRLTGNYCRFCGKEIDE